MPTGHGKNDGLQQRQEIMLHSNTEDAHHASSTRARFDSLSVGSFSTDRLDAVTSCCEVLLAGFRRTKEERSVASLLTASRRAFWSVGDWPTI